MGKRGDVSRVDAVAATKALVLLNEDGHELGKLQVRHHKGVDEENSFRRTTVRVLDGGEGKYYHFVFRSYVWSERSSMILSFILDNKEHKLMNKSVIEKLQEIQALWNLAGEPRQIEGNVPSYFHSHLETNRLGGQMFGFEIGDNAVTIYTNAEGDPFDYTVFFRETEDARNHAVRRWLTEHGQADRGYELQQHGYAELAPYGDRTTAQMHSICVHCDTKLRAWQYAVISEILPWNWDDSAELLSRFDAMPNSLAAENVIYPDGFEWASIWVYTPDEVQAALEAGKYGAFADYLMMVVDQAREMGRTITFQPHHSQSFIGPEYTFGCWAYVEVRMSAKDSIFLSEEYGAHKGYFSSSGRNTQHWAMQQLFNLLSALEQARSKKAQVWGMMCPGFPGFPGKELMAWLMDHEYNVFHIESEGQVGWGTFKMKARAAQFLTENYGSYHDMTALRQYLEHRANRSYPSLYRVDPVTGDWVDITSELVHHDFEMHYVSRGMSFGQYGWVITLPDGSELGLPMRSASVALEAWRLVTQVDVEAVRVRAERLLESARVYSDAKVHPTSPRSKWERVNHTLIDWFGLQRLPEAPTFVEVYGLEQYHRSGFKVKAALDERGNWWVTTYLPGSFEVHLNHLAVEVESEHWRRADSGAAYYNQYQFAHVEAEAVAMAIHQPTLKDVGKEIEVTLAGQTLTYKVREFQGKVVLDIVI